MDSIYSIMFFLAQNIISSSDFRNNCGKSTSTRLRLTGD